MEGTLLHEVEETEQPPNKNKNDGKRVILDQERFLPIANIARIMKGMIPSSGKVSKDAKECVQECVSEFISFLTAEACDRCKADKRKTISGDDLMKALVTLGFDDYVEPMEIFMNRYRSVMKFPNPRYTYPMTSPLLTTQVYDPAKPLAHQGPIVQVAPQHIQPARVMAAAPVQQTVYIAQAPTVAMPQQEPQQEQQQQYVVAPEVDMALEPTERLMIDPSTKQHYMMVERPDGTREWVPVNIVPETAYEPEVGADMPGIPKMDYAPVATTAPEMAPTEMAPTTSAPSTSTPSHPQRTPRTPRHAQKTPREEPTGPMRVTRSATRHAQDPYSKH